MSFRFVALTAVASILGAIALAGCSTGSEKENEPTAVGRVESELKLSGTRYLGKIANNETRTGYYYNPPRYRSYGFDAKGGDSISIDVKSVNGDAVAFITDTSYNVLALNDDASAYTYDSKVTYKVPSGTAAKSYRIVFRDYDLLDATFTVTLKITSSVTSTCAYDGDTYQQGQSFPSTDGCNTCTCGSGGIVGCTKMACSCDPANEPWRNYLGSPQQCMTISYTCAPGWSSFQNSCGCGCEQN